MRLDTATTQHPATATSTLRFINPPGLYDPRANGYTHVVVAPAPARTVFVAGQGGENAAGQLSADFGEQLRQAFTNLRIALAGAGASVHDVAKLTVLVVDHTEQRLALFSQAAQDQIQRWRERPAGQFAVRLYEDDRIAFPRAA